MVTVFHLEMVLMACAVVAQNQSRATVSAFRQSAPSPLCTADPGDVDECACIYGLGSVRGVRSRHTAVGKDHASPCGCAAVSGSSWCTYNVDNGAALEQRSKET